ncbi:unnamed protein product [Dovyalis caffra]|uniref:Uncharacterized protein n=1 Tax=Dovyalis caffra TaxID=77055 RepID=A0AAV1S206_9ROSI|nr:unnamed protein product [Dovyalis caffra]
MKGCDEKAIKEKCECGFKICRDCYLDCVGSNGAGHRPGCKESYKDDKEEGEDDDDDDVWPKDGRFTFSPAK